MKRNAIIPMQNPLRTLRLRDNRTAEFAEYGDVDAKPVFYFHSFLGSCSQAALSDALAHEHGIRIIAPNRPGIGNSTPKRFSCMIEYADDIAQLADALKIDQFAIFGISGGGCFALACAHALPNRVRLLGVASSMAPLSTSQNWRNMHWFRRFTLFSFENWPGAMATFLWWIFLIGRWFPKWIHHQMKKKSSMRELNQKHLEGINDVLWSDYENVFLQINGIYGLINEVHLYFHWGFDMHDFPKNIPVILWHGRNDTIVPLQIIRKLAHHIRLHSTVLYPGGHLIFLTHIREVFLRMQHAWNEMDIPAVFSAAPLFLAPQGLPLISSHRSYYHSLLPYAEPRTEYSCARQLSF